MQVIGLTLVGLCYRAHGARYGAVNKIEPRLLGLSLFYCAYLSISAISCIYPGVSGYHTVGMGLLVVTSRGYNSAYLLVYPLFILPLPL